MLSMDHNGFVNQPGLIDQSSFSDVTLRIVCEDGVTIDVATHRIMLARSSVFFESLFSNRFATAGVASLTIHGEPDVVREFFRLFHEPVFADSHLSTEKYAYIVSNVLALHQMAEQFLFQGLRKYCRHKLYERFDLNLFSLVFNQCLVRPHHQYSVIPERVGLFRRLIAWFVCCAEVHGNTLPFAVDTTQQSNSLIPPPQARTDDGGGGGKRKRKRPSVSSDKKLELLGFMRNVVANFDDYDGYSFRIHHGGSDNAVQIRSFGRVCHVCATDKSKIHIACVNEILPDGVSRRTWNIYLNLVTEGNEPSTLCVRANHYVLADGPAPAGGPHHTKSYNLVHSPPLLKCQAQATVLSKLYKNKCQPGLLVLSSLQSFTELLQFRLCDAAMCYEGQCDVCHTTQTRLYIVKYEIDVSTL